MLNLHFKSGLSYQSISSYRRIQRTIRKGDGRQTVKLVRWEVRICAVSVDEQFSAALFILGPGEPWWLKGFGLSGTKMEFLCGTMVGDFWFIFFHFLHIWASIDHSKLCSLCILDLFMPSGQFYLRCLPLMFISSHLWRTAPHPCYHLSLLPPPLGPPHPPPLCPWQVLSEGFLQCPRAAVL